MSRLTDLLDKTQSSSPGIGFATSRQAAAPEMVVIGDVSLTELQVNPALADTPVDALLVGMINLADREMVSRLGADLKDKLWGAIADYCTADDAKALRDAGCDFIVFNAEQRQASAAVLNVDDLGKVITVRGDFLKDDFNEGELEAIRTLDIDCALLRHYKSPEEEGYQDDSLFPLTVKNLLALQKMRALVRKRTIMDVFDEIGKDDLETLRNVGVTAISVYIGEDGADVERIKDDIAGLPRRRSQGGRTASTPSVGFAGGSAAADDDDYDDD